MSDVNAVNLISQMRTMMAQAEGMKVSTSQDGFSAVLKQALGEVNQANQTADAAKTAYETGDPSVSLADAMIAGQKSNLGFEATLRVRNSLVKAYQEIMTMPV
jgi:flagellar hook-basal body complex protein FliE